MKRWALIGSLISLSGCPSFQTLKTARALDKGEWQFTVAPEFELAEATGSDTGSFSFPEVEVAGRYGVSDGLDLGLKISTSGGIDLESTIQLLRGGFDVALAPSVGFYGFGISSGSGSGGWVFVPVAVPLLMGVNFGGGHQFVFGPKIYGTFISLGESSDGTSSSATAFGLEAGGVVGISLKLGPTFRLMPTIDLLVPIASTATSSSTSDGSSSSVSGNSAFAGVGNFIMQFGLGFSFGGDGFGKPAPSSNVSQVW